MNLWLTSNLALIALCIAVLVQTVRIMRCFRQLRSGGLGEMVEAMNRATDDSATVLADMRRLLATEGADHSRSLARSEVLRGELCTLRDELALMNDIGEGVAKRIMDAAAAAQMPASDPRPKTPVASVAAADILPEPRRRARRKETASIQVAAAC